MRQRTMVLPARERSLDNGDVHVWDVTLDEPASRYTHLLSPGERQQASKFHHEKDRKQYIVCHGIIRQILGNYLNITPEDIEFVFGSNGKPEVQQKGEHGLRFNLSHSLNRALLAVTLDTEIGIDIEYIRDIEEMGRIVERFCAGREKAEFHALPQDMKKHAFYLCWTRKEAFIKATGEGLTRPLDSYTVSITPGKPARLVELDGGYEEAAAWTIDNLELFSGFAAAVAYQGKAATVQRFIWQNG